jgi:hypothetical protein
MLVKIMTVTRMVLSRGRLLVCKHESIFVVVSSSANFDICNKVSAICVPATAGIRKRQRVFGLNGRKGCVDGLRKDNSIKVD